MKLINIMEGTNMILTKRRILGYFLGLLVVTPVVVFLLLTHFGYMEHHRYGFYCNDPSISFKFNGDTVTATELMCGTFFIPLMVILFSESVRCYNRQLSRWMEKLTIVLWKWYGGYILVLIINMVITAAIKFTFGEPRPHFLDTCRPDKAVNCTEGFIQNYKCTNTEAPAAMVADSYMSFLSGHTSLSVYCGLFTFWYAQMRMRSWCPLFVTITVQILVLYFGILCSISRITDHRHHWWDVLAGYFLAGFLTILAVRKYCDNFKCDALESAQIDLTTSTYVNKDTEGCYDNQIGL